MNRNEPRSGTYDKAKGRIQQAGQMMQDLAELKTRNAAAGTSAAGVEFAGSQRQTRKLIAATGLSKTHSDRTLCSGVDFASVRHVMRKHGSGDKERPANSQIIDEVDRIRNA
jgi:ATPase subunit of ABC transporter with duplicated ATPase domains